VHARVKLRGGETETAAKLANSAEQLLRNAQGTGPITVQLVLAEIALASGGDATEPVATARALLDALNGPVYGTDRQTAMAWRSLGDLYGDLGRRPEQTTAYRRALEAAGVRSAMAGVATDVNVTR